MTSAASVPWASLDTLFLDVGNTLLTIDFEWVQRELACRGVDCEVDALARAEAAGRPRVSDAVAAGRSSEHEDSFHFYLRCILEGLPEPARVPPAELGPLIAELAGVLRIPGEALRLWCRVIPGTVEALEELRALDLTLVAVSNADGSVERGLVQAGLRAHLGEVFDSHVVGHEKPDPRIFHHALARTGADPRRTLHVGDLYAVDVVGARAAGIHPLLLDPHRDWPEVDCHRLPDLAALARRIREARAGAAG